MGLIVEKNKAGKYKLISTNTDEPIHDEQWISEEDAKAILICRTITNFERAVIEIDLDFPAGYANNKMQLYVGDQPSYNFMMEGCKKPFLVHNKFIEILEKYNLQSYFQSKSKQPEES